MRVNDIEARHFGGSSAPSAGSVTLMLEVVEGEQHRAVFIDSRETRNRSGTTRTSTQRDFERVMDQFSEDSIKAIAKHSD